MKRYRLLMVSLTSLAFWLGCEGPPGTTPSPLSLAVASQRTPNQQLQAEKERIAREAERSEAVYDSLNALWDQQPGDYEVTQSGIVNCEPLRYAGDAKIVGPDGAEMSVGPHKLRILRGALRTNTVITVEMPVALWVGVRLSPEGQTFAIQPQLTLSYRHCFLPTNHAERVVYTDDAQNIVEYPRSRDRTGGDALVDAWLWHFSNYAIAW